MQQAAETNEFELTVHKERSDGREVVRHEWGFVMRLGEQQELYPYLASVDRPRNSWRKGVRLAVVVMPNLEHFEVTNGSGKLDVKTFAVGDYGNRVGWWRMLDIFDRLGVSASIAINSSVCQHYPKIVQSCVERNYEFLGHGITNSEDLDELDDKEAAEAVRLSLDVIRSITERPVRGWLGTGLAEKESTLDDLKKNNIEYVCEWGLSDDQPFTLSNGIVAMPYSLELNDRRYFSGGGSGAGFLQGIRDTFDVLYEEGAEQLRVLCLSLHPFLIGSPSRIRYLSEALEYMAGHDGVWWAQASEVLDAYRGLENNPEGLKGAS
jgi:peptidoglycan/xylan/chitin deacetylase (PgdA/CDA1 family)